MADDWIKLRSNLWDHPKIVRIVSAICPKGVRDLSLKCRVIGALYRTWCIADTHTKDGILDGYDADSLNADIGIEGWAESLQHVGWLIIETQRIIVPRFEDHNGESAKRRAEDSKRKRESRKTSAKRPQNVRKKPDKNRTREEKRREENIDVLSKDNTLSDKPTKCKFIKPTLEEVAEFCRNRNNGIDPEAFIASNDAKGWLVGKTQTPMKDWRAVIVTWEKNKAERKNGKLRPGSQASEVGDRGL